MEGFNALYTHFHSFILVIVYVTFNNTFNILTCLGSKGHCFTLVMLAVCNLKLRRYHHVVIVMQALDSDSFHSLCTVKSGIKMATTCLPDIYHFKGHSSNIALHPETIIWSIRDGEPRTATSTFTQFLNSNKSHSF